MWTVFAGLHFDFTDAIGVKGIFYHQAGDSEIVDPVENKWNDYGLGAYDDKGEVIEDANHWAAIIDVKQDFLKYTSLWLEYGAFDQGFWSSNGDGAIFYSGSNVVKGKYLNGASAANDITYFRVGLGQQWTDKFATYIAYYGYTVKDYVDENNKKDDKNPSELSLGVQYKLNDATTMGLNYMMVNGDFDGNDDDPDKDNVIRFRTAISF